MATPTLQITPLKLGQLDTNCYLVWCKQTKHCVIIDPADSGDFITQQLLDLELTPLSIMGLVTFRGTTG